MINKSKLAKGLLGEKVVESARRLAQTMGFEDPYPDGESIAKPLTTKEKNTLLHIIAILCDMHKFDISKPYEAGKRVSDHALQLGLNIGEETIGKKLKDAAELLDPLPQSATKKTIKSK